MKDKESFPVFSPANMVYIGICAAVFIIATLLFQNDLNLTLTRLSEQPVGIVTYKNRAAQRRFVDRVLWDRLRQESPVYIGDYVRTAALSQVTVSFTAGDSIELEENTLIQIVGGQDKLRIDLADGGLSVDSRAGAVRVRVGEAVVETASGSVALVAATPAGLKLVALDGSAELREGGERRELAAGEAYAAGGLSPGRVTALFPRPGAKLLNNGEGPLPVAFRWNRSGSGGEAVLLDIAEDRSFNRMLMTIKSGEDGAVVELANGFYYWRAYASSEAGRERPPGSPPDEAGGKLTVASAPAPRLVRPRPGDVFRFSAAPPGIRFQWTASEGASAYLVEAADNPGMENVVYRSQAQAAGDETGSAVYSGLGQGTWYWRVSPVYGRDYEGTPAVSATGHFRIERTAGPAAPQLMERQETIYIEGGAAYFAWKQEEEAVSYTFLLSEQENLSRPLVEKTTLDNYYAFDPRDAGLNPRRYYWGVYQTDREGKKSKSSTAQSLTLASAVPPVRPLPASSPPPPAEATPAAAAATPSPAAAPARAAPAASSPAAASPAAAAAAPAPAAPPARAALAASPPAAAPPEAAAAPPAPAASPARAALAASPPAEASPAAAAAPPAPAVAPARAALAASPPAEASPAAAAATSAPAEASPEAAAATPSPAAAPARAAPPAPAVAPARVALAAIPPAEASPAAAAATSAPAVAPAAAPPEAAAATPSPAAAPARAALAASPPAAASPEAAAATPAEASPKAAASLPSPSRLPDPANLRPAAGYLLTEEIILRDQRIDFSWNAVSGAVSYLFAIYQGEQEIFCQTLRSPSYTLKYLSLLDEGTFTWLVQALPAGQNDTVTALPGEAAESSFTIELEEIQAARGNQSGVMFGIQ